MLTLLYFKIRNLPINEYNMKNLFTFAIIISLLAACNQALESVQEKTQKVGKVVKEEAIKPSEPHRPSFHFTPPEKWMNDPNGMVYFEGEYHLFYQHYPDDIVWGPMHWGHAVSQDLVQWEHLPIALYPDSLGYIFSGSAVIDWENTSGFGTNGKPPMIAIYTYHDPVGAKAGTNTFQYQGIAYSNDKGRTWTKYTGNPVVPNPGIRDFRDPKVIWDKDSKQWVMVFAAWDHVKLYGSSNLKDWKHLSDFGRNWGTHAGVWECPDLFPIKIAGTNEQKWVLLQSLNPGGPNGGSGTQYFIGDFDGTYFTIDNNFAKAFGRVAAVVPEGEVFENFENGYSNWIIEGTAFGKQPATGAFEGQKSVEGFEGSSLVSSFSGRDQAMGRMQSRPFTIKKPFINFLIGGGKDQLRTRMSLVIDGEKQRSASGKNGEQLVWTGWDVTELIGKTAYLEIVDNHPGGWGHINVDQIVFAEELAQAAYDKAIWLDYGRDNYAGVTWSDIPDGRRIFMGWMSNWDYAQVVPTEKWRSAMTVARELKLKHTEHGLRLFTTPVQEVEQLRKSNIPLLAGDYQDLVMTSNNKGMSSEVEINLKFTIPENLVSKLFITAYNEKGEQYNIGFDAAKNQFFSDRTKSGKTDFSSVFAQKIHYAPRIVADKEITIRVLFDRSSVELFADDGATVLTDIFFPSEDFSGYRIYAQYGEVNILEGQLYILGE